MNQTELLHTAVRSNDRSLLDTLHRSGVDLNSVYYGTTALLISIETGNVDVACWLVDSGCDVLKMDINGKSAFEEAVCRDQIKVVEKLLEKGVDVNERLRSGHTALTYATGKKLTNLVHTLVEAGADVCVRNYLDETPVFIAAQHGYGTILDNLLKHRQKSTLLSTGTDSHILAPSSLDLGFEDNREEVLEAPVGGPRVSVEDSPCGLEGLTPLIASVINDHLTTAQILIKAGCDVNIPDSNGWTALWHATVDSNELLAKKLVCAGADIHVTNREGKTLLEEAMENESDELIALLKRKV